MRDDELDERLRRLDRMAGVRIRGDVLDRVRDATRERAVRSARRRLAAVCGAVLVGVGGLVAAPAAADAVREWLAVTDWQQPSGEVMIDLAAPDVLEYVEASYPEWIPLPPGTTPEDLVAEVVAQWGNPQADYAEDAVIRVTYEMTAYCMWIGERLASDDPPRVATADRVLADVATWPAIVETDGDIVVEIIAEIARQAAAGDREAVLFGAEWFHCAAADGESHFAWFEERREYFDGLWDVQ